MLPLATFAASAAVGVGKNLLNTLAKTDANTMDTTSLEEKLKELKTIVKKI